MYHPPAALHQASLRETLVRDIRGLSVTLLDVRRARRRREQMTLS